MNPMDRAMTYSLVIVSDQIEPISPRSGSENRGSVSWNLVQNLVQLGAEEAPITPIRSCLLH